MLQTDDLEKALKGYKGFHGVYAVDHLPKRKDMGLYIANTDPSDEGGEHWVLYYVHGDVVEFFDTFGRTPKERWPGEWLYSGKVVQSPLSAACGYHVLWFAHMRKTHPFREIIGMYGPNLRDNDVFVERRVKSLYQ